MRIVMTIALGLLPVSVMSQNLDGKTLGDWLRNDKNNYQQAPVEVETQIEASEQAKQAMPAAEIEALDEFPQLDETESSEFDKKIMRTQQEYLLTPDLAVEFDFADGQIESSVIDPAPLIDLPEGPESRRDFQIDRAGDRDVLPISAEVESTPVVPVDNRELKFKTRGGFEISRADDSFSFEFGGRIMLDAFFARQDQVTLGNGTELRRARLEFQGTVYREWAYKLVTNIGDGDAEVKSAYLQYLAEWPPRLRIGQFKEPFSLEEQTSSLYITFLERSLPVEFAPGLHMGIGIHSAAKNWTFATGLFGDAYDADADDEGDEGWGLSARATFAPWRQDSEVLHLGASVSHRQTDDGREIDFSVRPEAHGTDVKFANTGDIEDSKSYRLFGLETAWVSGPWSIQGEYIEAGVSRSQGLADLDFSGAYIFASWFATGESRRYKFKNGNFGQVKPNARSGAWEFALRFSRIDLSDADIRGGVEKNTTVGVNWYANPQLKFMLNYIMIDNDSEADDDGTVVGNDQPSLLQLRAQIDF